MKVIRALAEAQTDAANLLEQLVDIEDGLYQASAGEHHIQTINKLSIQLIYIERDLFAVQRALWKRLLNNKEQV